MNYCELCGERAMSGWHVQIQETGEEKEACSKCVDKLHPNDRINPVERIDSACTHDFVDMYNQGGSDSQCTKCGYQEVK